MLKIFVFVFILSVARTVAQEPAKELLHHQIGVSASTSSGSGIHYSYIFSTDYKVKLTGFYLSETGGSIRSRDITDFVIGIEGQKTLINRQYTRLYTLLGMGYYRQSTYYPSQNDQMSRYTGIKNSYSAGTGIGIEFLPASRISINIELGLSYISLSTHYDNYEGVTPANPKTVSESYFGLGGGIGFGFQF